MSDEAALSVEGLVEYCRTQAGILAGRAETIAAETDALLDEIDEDIADIRARLRAHNAPDASAGSPPTARSDGTDEVDRLEELESELEEKQAVAEAKNARMTAFQDLSVAYVELATELAAGTDDGSEALERVVRFEHDSDAPAYFDDRQTLLEAAAESDG